MKKKMYLFRDILIKLESPLLQEQKRYVAPSDKSCIINQYKQTFMTIMDDLEIEAVLPNLTVGLVYLTNIHLASAFFPFPFCAYGYQNGWNKSCQKESSFLIYLPL